MNIENLQKAADYIKTIPQEMFDMGTFREGQTTNKECDSVGSVLGHCTVLDPNILRFRSNDVINFEKWSESFFELGYYSYEWDWCFCSVWKYVDNTPIGASKRIQYLIDHGLPKNWNEQIDGFDKLCYCK